MRIAMVSARGVPQMGGIETHIAEVAPRLARLGVDVTLLTTHPGGDVPIEESRDGVTIRRFAAYPKGRDYYFSPAIGREVEHGHFDLVHVQGVHTFVPPLALSAARRAGTPSVLTFHTGGSSSPLRRMIRSSQWRAERSLLRSTRRLIAVCEYEADLFTRSLGVEQGHIELIRNGAEPLPTAPTEGSPPLPMGFPLLLSIGRLERYKGHHRAIAAMPALLRKAPGAHLVLVGNGPYRDRLCRLVEELGLTAHVSFTSFPPEKRAELGRLVASADAVVLLSEYEAHPVAVVEALALGRDVVVAETSGLTELGRYGLARTVELDAPPERTAEVLLAAASEKRWSSGPPPLPNWDDCAKSLQMTYESVLG